MDLEEVLDQLKSEPTPLMGLTEPMRIAWTDEDYKEFLNILISPWEAHHLLILAQTQLKMHGPNEWSELKPVLEKLLTKLKMALARGEKEHGDL